MPASIRRAYLLLVALSVFHAATAKSTISPGIARLIALETQANPMGLRSSEPISLGHFEIPLRRVQASTADYASPALRDAIVFQKNGEPYVRWLINPDDTTYYLQAIERLRKEGLDATVYRGYFTGYRTASSSLIINASNGTVFSAKVSTDRAGGAWQNKPVSAQTIHTARTISDYIHKIAKGPAYGNLVFQYDVMGLSLPGIDQGMLVRDLAIEETLGKGRSLVPGFAFVHESHGPDLARRAGKAQPIDLLVNNVAPAVGVAEANLLTHFGAFMGAPHGQNIVVEMETLRGASVPSGRTVLRDLGDLKFPSALYSQGELPPSLKSIPRRTTTRTYIGLGLSHGAPMASWLNQADLNRIGQSFFNAFDREFSTLTGFPYDKLRAQTTEFLAGSYAQKFLEWHELNTLAGKLPVACGPRQFANLAGGSTPPKAVKPGTRISQGWNGARP